MQGGPDPTRQERIAIAGVKSERISAKPETKAALGGPRRAPSPGSPRPRHSSPLRELPKRLSSTPRFARGAAPGRVRSWCPRRAAHWDPPGMSGAQGGHWRAGRDNSPAPLAPAASTHPKRRLQGEPAAREWRPSTHHEPQPGASAPVRTHQAKAPAAGAPGTGAGAKPRSGSRTQAPGTASPGGCGLAMSVIE